MQTGRKHVWRRRIAVMVAGCLAAFLVLELALRWIPAFEFPKLVRLDPLLGWSLKPGAKVRWTSEGDGQVEINSFGFRSNEWSVEKPPGTFRVCVLGDSYTEGRQVEFEDTYCALLERRLQECTGRDVEVLNFGVSGYGTGQELLLLHSGVVQRFSPDLVVLAFYENDLRDNSPHFLSGTSTRPYCQADNGSLKTDTQFSEGLSFRIRLASHLVQAIAHSRRSFLSGQISGLPPARHLVFSPNEPEETKAWNITEDLLRLFHGEATADGAKFLLIVLNTPLEVYPELDTRRAILEKAELDVSDLTYMADRLNALGSTEGFPVIALGPEMRTYAEAEGVFLHGFKNTALGIGHWNKEGHRLAAQILSDQLCEGSLSSLLKPEIDD